MKQTIIIKIEKLSNLGFGIAKDNKTGKVVFVQNACPGDVLRAEIFHENKNYSFANILEIITPSIHRVTPACSIQKICGACQLQFINYNYQLCLKRQIIADALKNIAGLQPEIQPVIPSPNQFECRKKIQYAVRKSNIDYGIKIGYYKNKSHDLIDIKFCPLQPKICNDIIDYIRQNAKNFGVTGYDEKNLTGELRHIVLRCSATGKILLTFVINSKNASKAIRELSENVYAKFDEISGVCINFNISKSNVILTDNTICICGKQFITEKICNIEFKIETNTFFQVNPKTAQNIFEFVKNYISNNFDKPTILDAYAGIATFGLILSDVAKSVSSVESCKESIDLAESVKTMNNIDNVELVHEDSEKFFAKLYESGKNYDIIILDPPRKGCSEKTLEYCLKLAKKQIIYISCNPATLARDLKFLTQNGIKIKHIQPFDMFCHTYHVETVCILYNQKK